jgi:hypothetical protein
MCLNSTLLNDYTYILFFMDWVLCIQCNAFYHECLTCAIYSEWEFLYLESKSYVVRLFHSRAMFLMGAKSHMHSLYSCEN